jgi:large subunit ribosomal protein L29
MASNVEEYRQMDEEELYGRLGQAKQELFNLRFQLVTGRLDNSSRLGQVRKDVARILTVMREREIAAAEALAAAGPSAPEALAPQPAAVAAGADQGEVNDV